MGWLLRWLLTPPGEVSTRYPSGGRTEAVRLTHHSVPGTGIPAEPDRCFVTWPCPGRKPHDGRNPVSHCPSRKKWSGAEPRALSLQAFRPSEPFTTRRWNCAQFVHCNYQRLRTGSVFTLPRTRIPRANGLAHRCHWGPRLKFRAARWRGYFGRCARGAQRPAQGGGEENVQASGSRGRDARAAIASADFSGRQGKLVANL